MKNVESIPSPGEGELPVLAGLSRTRAAVRGSWRRQWIILTILAAALAVCFVSPLLELFGFAWDSKFFSYIPLMPAIAGYLIWLKRDQVEPGVRPAWAAAAAAAAAGGVILAASALATRRGWHPTEEDYLAVMTSGLLLFLVAAAFAVMGWAAMKTMAFPVAMLAFMVPCPEHLLDVITYFFQQTSATAAWGMLRLAGTAIHKDGLLLLLPDVKATPRHAAPFELSVAPECSGIHSTMVLLITSLIAGHLFLRSPWRRTGLALFVIPLAIARNGFRIFVLGELCVHVKADMIDTPIHLQGGPIFFVLSLIPFFLLLIWLRKRETRQDDAGRA